MFKRRGTFRIPSALVDRIDDDPGILMVIMQNVFIVKAEHDYATRNFEYMAMSSLFDELEPGMVLPEYKFVITRAVGEEAHIIRAERI